MEKVDVLSMGSTTASRWVSKTLAAYAKQKAIDEEMAKKRDRGKMAAEVEKAIGDIDAECGKVKVGPIDIHVGDYYSVFQENKDGWAGKFQLLLLDVPFGILDADAHPHDQPPDRMFERYFLLTGCCSRCCIFFFLVIVNVTQWCYFFFRFRLFDIAHHCLVPGGTMLLFYGAKQINDLFGAKFAYTGACKDNRCPEDECIVEETNSPLTVCRWRAYVYMRRSHVCEGCVHVLITSLSALLILCIWCL